MGIFGRLQDYLQDAAMDQILRRKIIYNVAWEDPAVVGPDPDDWALAEADCARSWSE